jgi:hypothetical protein
VAFDPPILQLQLKTDRGRHRFDPLALGLLHLVSLIEKPDDGHSGRHNNRHQSRDTYSQLAQPTQFHERCFDWGEPTFAPAR